MNGPAPLDAAAVQALVAEVVRRIRAAEPPAGRGGASSSSAVAAESVAAGGTTIAERVITLACIERVPAGIREVAAVANAVITPSAADRARERGLRIVRGGTATPPPARPFVIAHAGCRGDAAARTGGIARAVPGSQQLPASGLADVIAAVAGHAARDAARGVLLTSRPALAVVLANRSASLRAVTGRDAATVASAAADAAANLLVVDPASFTGRSLERLCADFHRGPPSPVPAELQAAPPGCGCKTHPH